MASNKAVASMLAMLETLGFRLPGGDRNALLTVWVAVLGDVPDDALQAAVVAYARTSTAWPTPAAILRCLPGAEVVDDADEAWGAFLREARRFGYYNPPPKGHPWWPGDPARSQAIERAYLGAFGSWSGYCVAEDETMTAHRASFRGGYRSARTRPADSPLALPDGGARLRLLTSGIGEER